MWKMAAFQGIWTKYHAFPYIHFIPISMQQKMFKVIFRILDEKSSHIHILRRQITEIGNLPRDLWWPWPQKRSPRAKNDA